MAMVKIFWHDFAISMLRVLLVMIEYGHKKVLSDLILVMVMGENLCDDFGDIHVDC